MRLFEEQSTTTERQTFNCEYSFKYIYVKNQLAVCLCMSALDRFAGSEKLCLFSKERSKSQLYESFFLSFFLLMNHYKLIAPLVRMSFSYILVQNRH